MFEILLKMFGYLPHEAMWLYPVLIIVFFVSLIIVIVRLLGGIR